MSTISEIYPISAEIKKLYVFLGDWFVEGTLKTGESVLKLNGGCTLAQLQAVGD